MRRLLRGGRLPRTAGQRNRPLASAERPGGSARNVKPASTPRRTTTSRAWCEMNTYSARRRHVLRQLPAGQETSTSGFPVCNCKSGHYFDTAKLRYVQAELWSTVRPRPQWDDLSCVACEDLLPEGRFRLEFGARAAAPSSRPPTFGRGLRLASVLLIGSAVAAPGFFLKVEECVVPRPTFKDPATWNLPLR